MTPTELALQRAEAGLAVDASSLSERARRALALAAALGAPRGPVLAALVAVEEAEAVHRRELELALAGPTAVARGLVLAPPVVGPLTALLVTNAPFAVWATRPGQVVALLATLLWLAGWGSVRLLVRRAATVPTAAGGGRDEVLELLAIAVAAGSSLPAAARRVGGVADDGEVRRLALWLQLGGGHAPPAGWREVGPTLATAHRDGAPLVPLLRALAAADRAAQHQAARARVARLEARLAVPTTLLLLPAAGLVVAAPLVHGLLATLA